VLPSLTENFGNAAAEAIALGTPAVVTDQCGVATLVTETGMGRVVAVDTHAVIAAIDDVIANGSDPSAAAAALARYAPDAVAAEQLKIYELVRRRA
jgi:glycosyltransferase involved in cell wall biosynthesis